MPVLPRPPAEVVEARAAAEDETVQFALDVANLSPPEQSQKTQ